MIFQTDNGNYQHIDERDADFSFMPSGNVLAYYTAGDCDTFLPFVNLV